MAAALGAVIALFLSAQVLLSVHAVKYGDGPHDHDGAVCVLSLASHSADKMLASAVYFVAAIVSVYFCGGFAAQSERAGLLVLSANPRAPPKRS